MDPHANGVRYPLFSFNTMEHSSFRALSVILCLWAVNLVPASGQSTFYARYASCGFTGGRIAKAPDKGFYGASYLNADLEYYKVDEDGDLLWVRSAALAPHTAPAYIATLSDTTFAFIAHTQGQDSTLVFKVRDNGVLVWVRSLYIGTSANFQALAPTTDGGMILTGGGCSGADMIIHLDAQGHIRSQHRHFSPDSPSGYPNAMDMLHEGDDQYAYMGFAANGPGDYRPLAFWRSDSAGTVYNYREIHLPQGMAFFSLGRSLVRSTNGGHYIAVMLNDTVQDHFMLLYLDEQDELVWCKDIAYTTDLITQRGLAATEDGDCVVIGTRLMSTSPMLDLPFAMRFDQQGTLITSRRMGDSSVTGWQSFSLLAVEAMDDGGFMTIPCRGGNILDFCKVDADLHGFCHDGSMDPLLTDLTPMVVPLELIQFPLAFVEGTVELDPVPLPYSREDLCYYTGIAEVPDAMAMTLAPNPASDDALLTLHLDRPERVEVVLMNSVGAICSSHWVQALPNEPIRIGSSRIAQGSYIVEVRSAHARQRARLVVQR